MASSSPHIQRGFALVTGPSENPIPIVNAAGKQIVFRTERQAEEALAQIGIRKYRAFLNGTMAFEDAFGVLKEFYLPVVRSSDGKYRAIAFDELDSRRHGKTELTAVFIRG